MTNKFLIPVSNTNNHIYLPLSLKALGYSVLLKKKENNDVLYYKSTFEASSFLRNVFDS